MRDSVDQQLIHEDDREEQRRQWLEWGEHMGRVEVLRELLLDLGTGRLGAPRSAMALDILRINDLDALRHMTRAVLSANSWQELLAAGQD